jgi:hypothetical protein
LSTTVSTVTARPRLARRARRAVDALLVVVGLAAMVWMDRHQPNLTANQAPFPTRGTIGAQVRGRDFALTVDRLALTRVLELPGALSSALPQRRETNGVWLLVDARFDALHEPLALPGGFGAPSLRTRDGLVYAAASGRMPTSLSLLTSATAAPGISARGLLVFELPPERLPGAVLIASSRTISALDSVVEIDLRLTDADVRRRIETMPASITLDRSGVSW